jgi:hypothetical protein
MELGEYDHQEVEAAARALWEARDIYAYDRDAQGACVQRGHGTAMLERSPGLAAAAGHARGRISRCHDPELLGATCS